MSEGFNVSKRPDNVTSGSGIMPDLTPKPHIRPEELRKWRYRVTLKGTVLARSVEEAEEKAMDAAADGDAEDDDVEVELA